MKIYDKCKVYILKKMENQIKILFVEDVQDDAELIWKEISKNGINFEKKLTDNRKSFASYLKT